MYCLKIPHFVPFRTLLFTNPQFLPTSPKDYLSGVRLVSLSPQKILLLQKRALRLVCFRKKSDHSIPLFKTKLLPIHSLYF